MASYTSTLPYFATTLIIIIILSLPHQSHSADLHLNWHVPDNNDTSYYTRWAADNRFHVGDSILFQYRNDSVMVVDKYAYYHCNTTNPIYVFRDGAKTEIELDRPGPFYLISGDADHCRNGQRLEVDVMSDSPPHHPIADDDSAPAPAPAPNSGCIVEAEILAIAVAGLVALANSRC